MNHILIADDEPSIGSLIEATLQGPEVSTTHVTTGKQVLESVQQQVSEATRAMKIVTEQVTQGEKVTVATVFTVQATSRDVSTLIGHVQAIAQASAVQSEKVNEVASDIAAVAQTTQQQLECAHRLASCAGQVRGESESLLTEVGVFRFEGHRKARQMIEAAIAAWRLERIDGVEMEARLAELCRREPALELLYVTDETGVQHTGNVSAAGCDASVKGADWRERRWFQDALADRKAYVSHLYRSVATGEFCFTVSAPLRNRAGRLLGVLGADVRFDHIVSL